MLWFNFILVLICAVFCFKLIITHYRTKKQNKEIKPKIKLNHNILYNYVVVNFLCQAIFDFLLFLGMLLYANEVETKEK